MKDLWLRFIRWLAELTPAQGFLLALSSLASIALIDVGSPIGMSFTLCYALVIAFAGWAAGASAGAILALVPAGITCWEDWQVVKWQEPLVLSWNVVTRLILFFVVGSISARLSRITRAHEQTAKERTEQWQGETERHLTTLDQLSETIERFEQVINNITEVFWLTNLDKSKMIYISPGYERIWGRTRAELHARPTSWLDAIHPEDRAEVDRRSKSDQITQHYDVEYRIIRPDGSERWIRDRAFPVRNASGDFYRVAGIAEDISDQKRLERQILEITDREQARIGQDIHDGLCQELVSIAFDARNLESQLDSTGSPEAPRAHRMATDLDNAITKARQVARGLFPIRMEGEGVISALEELAAGVSERWKLDCRLRLKDPVQIPKGAIAIHLYRIAQEAVNNATKHSSARQITINLGSDVDTIQLDVEDDGVGLPEDAKDSTSDGLGMHIMQYRARTIGASLELKTRAGGGTIVSCRLENSGGNPMM